MQTGFATRHCAMGLKTIFDLIKLPSGESRIKAAAIWIEPIEHMKHFNSEAQYETY